MPPFAPGHPDDSAFQRAVSAGNAEAVTVWYRREHPEVYRLALGFLARPEEAEDLAQDAMLHLLNCLPAPSSARSYRAWRNAIVANLCRDRLRQHRTRTRHERRVPERGPCPSPEDDVNQSELRARLTVALRDLTEREREVFVLRDLESFSCRETAEVLGISQGTVRSLLSLARRRLRTLLDPQLMETDR